ncbi:transporter substrate-binding domain-containing protein [Agrobacterium sp. CCNWLW71]|uniref:transporter substrate-binding domain-containing protein n=1 Tax=unclassified Agrobacterium TaxID=2632611 RepID=UPI002FF14793
MPALTFDIGEIAPTGSIRAAVNIANAALVRFEERTGELIGPSVDLAKSLAAEIGCQLLVKAYPSAAAIMAADERNDWDIAFIAADPSRADRFDFSPPYAFVTATYLVLRDSHIYSVAEVDVPGCRISAAGEAAYTKQLERLLKDAAIVYTESPTAAIEMLKTGGCDAAAGLKDFLQDAAAQGERLRTLEGTFLEIPQTVAIRKGTKAAPFVSDFVGTHVKNSFVR